MNLEPSPAPTATVCYAQSGNHAVNAAAAAAAAATVLRYFDEKRARTSTARRSVGRSAAWSSDSKAAVADVYETL